MHARPALIATAIAIVCFAIAPPSHADDEPSPDLASKIEDAPTSAPAQTQSSSGGLHPHIVTDLRFGALFRNNTDYFSEADTFGYPIPSGAVGVVGDLGVEIVPRFTIAVAGSYYAESAKRRFAKLALSSDALLLQARFAVFRSDADDSSNVPFAGAVELVLGGGRYWIRESYSDPSLFAGSIAHDASSYGFSAGTDAWFAVGPARFVLGYAYHWAPAGITNDIGGEVRAGGHEITLGLGARF
jgi:hypothetical protein